MSTSAIDDVRHRQGAAEARGLPHDLQAEESVLGAMLLRGDAVVAALRLLAADDFYKPAHGRIFDAIRELHSRGKASDPVTVADELRRAGCLDEVGGGGVLIGLQAGTPTIGGAASYAEIVRRDSLDRRLALRAEDVREAVLSRLDLGPALQELQAATAARAALDQDDAARRSRVDGAMFVLDTPPDAQAVWGDDERVAWASGEPLLINGPAGVGKTTIAQQLALARLGLRTEVLGLPVAADGRRVLYIAADRPPQAARSFRRMVVEEDRDVLAGGLVVWRGPLPFSVVKTPDALAELAEANDAGTVVIDSLKDIAPNLSDEETGNAVNQALQLVCLAGAEVLALHHQRKRQQGAGKPKTLDDVYGSTWLTAGAGSVLLVWGEPGDAVVELSHLKQPVDAIGPLTLLHDHEHGATTVQDEVDLLEVVRTSNGLAALGAARALFKKEAPERNEIERARRRLEQLCKNGLVHREEPRVGGDGGGKAARYYAIDQLREAL